MKFATVSGSATFRPIFLGEREWGGGEGREGEILIFYHSVHTAFTSGRLGLSSDERRSELRYAL